MHEAGTQVSGWIIGAGHAWGFLAVWLVVALAYGVWRSRGKASPDPIRPPGPFAP